MDDTAANREPDYEALYRLSSGQAGYFTARQASEAGYGWSLLSHHVGSGLFRRVCRGIYRLRDYPSSQHEDLVATQLRLGPDAVISHGSALDVLELSDAIPDTVHVTLPRERRGIASIPGVRIHTVARPMNPADLVRRGPILLTSPARSIGDAATAGLEPAQVTEAVRQALARGLVTASGMRKAIDGAPVRVRELVFAALDSTA